MERDLLVTWTGGPDNPNGQRWQSTHTVPAGYDDARIRAYLWALIDADRADGDPLYADDRLVRWEALTA